jgi:hypothetical protein
MGVDRRLERPGGVRSGIGKGPTAGFGLQTRYFRFKARHGLHFTGVTTNKVPLLELTQPAAVSLQGSFSG